MAEEMKEEPNGNEKQADDSVHIANMRQAFDGMRAYHNSEIAHKKDAIEILKTILTTTVLVYGGLVGLVVSQQIDGCFAFRTSIVLIFCVILAVFFIAHITNIKIDNDNKRYRDFFKEYLVERELLLVEEYVRKAGIIYPPHDPNKTGYHHTKKIIRRFGFIIVTVAIIGSVFVFGILITRNNDSKKECINHHHPPRHKHIR